MSERKPLGPVGTFLAKAPRHLYRLGLGRVLGRRFVMVEHTGRISGLPRQTVLEVIRRDDRSLDVAAAWGSGSDWVRNVTAEPSVRLSTGGMRSAPATATALESSAATSALREYAALHPRAAKALGRALGLDFSDPATATSTIPVVRFAFR